MSHSSRLVEGIAYDGKPPSDVPRHRWRQFVGHCRAFEFVRNLGSSEIWAWKADRLSWDAMVLFGCAPKPKRPARLFRQRRSRVGNQRREAHRAISRFGQSSDLPVNRPGETWSRRNSFCSGRDGGQPRPRAGAAHRCPAPRVENGPRVINESLRLVGAEPERLSLGSRLRACPRAVKPKSGVCALNRRNSEPLFRRFYFSR